MLRPRSLLITGASSGIGAALAEAYAAPGMRLALAGRNATRLDRVAHVCRQAGADVSATLVDVADRDATADWVRQSDRAAPLDLVIANAGVSAGTAGRGESEDQARHILDVNFTGVLNTVLPVLPAMQARRRGQLALMSSVASFRGFAAAPAYCASKAGVRVWGEGLRGALARHGIAVSVICPGFVESAMTAGNRFSMPFLMDGARAAQRIRRGLARNRGRIVFPWPMAALIWTVAALPPALTDLFVHDLPEKAPLEMPPPRG